MSKELKVVKKDLGAIPNFKTNDKDITAGTASEPNPVKVGVSVGRKGYVKEASVNSIESLAPDMAKTTDGQ